MVLFCDGCPAFSSFIPRICLQTTSDSACFNTQSTLQMDEGINVHANVGGSTSRRRGRRPRRVEAADPAVAPTDKDTNLQPPPPPPTLPRFAFEDDGRRIGRHLRVAKSKIKALVNAIRTGPSDALAVGVPPFLAGADALSTADEAAAVADADRDRDRDRDREPESNNGGPSSPPLFARRRRQVVSKYSGARQRNLQLARQAGGGTISTATSSFSSSRNTARSTAAFPTVDDQHMLSFDPSLTFAEGFKRLHGTHPLKRAAVLLHEFVEDHVAKLWTDHKKFELAEKDFSRKVAEQAAKRELGGFLALYPERDDGFSLAPYGKYGSVPDSTPPALPPSQKPSPQAKTTRTVPTLASLAAFVAGRHHARLSASDGFLSCNLTAEPTGLDLELSSSDSDDDEDSREPLKKPRAVGQDADVFTVVPALCRREFLLSHVLELSARYAPIPVLIRGFIKTCLSANYVDGAYACLLRLIDLWKEAFKRPERKDKTPTRQERQLALGFWKECWQVAVKCSREEAILDMLLEEAFPGPNSPALLRIELFCDWDGLKPATAVTLACKAIQMLCSRCDSNNLEASRVRLFESLARLAVTRSLVGNSALFASAFLGAAAAVSQSEHFIAEAPSAVQLLCFRALGVDGGLDTLGQRALVATALTQVETADPSLIYACYRSHPELLHRMALLISFEGASHGLACRILQQLMDSSHLIDPLVVADDLQRCESRLKQSILEESTSSLASSGGGAASRKWRFEPVTGVWEPKTPAIVRATKGTIKVERTSSESDESIGKQRAGGRWGGRGGSSRGRGRSGRGGQKPATVRSDSDGESESQDEDSSAEDQSDRESGSDDSSAASRSSDSEEEERDEDEATGSESDGSQDIRTVTGGVSRLSVTRRRDSTSSSTETSGTESGSQSSDDSESGSEEEVDHRLHVGNGDAVSSSGSASESESEATNSESGSERESDSESDDETASTRTREPARPRSPQSSRSSSPARLEAESSSGSEGSESSEASDSSASELESEPASDQEEEDDDDDPLTVVDKSAVARIPLGPRTTQVMPRASSSTGQENSGLRRNAPRAARVKPVPDSGKARHNDADDLDPLAM